MYRNILFISDNLTLCKGVEKILKQPSFTKFNFRFAISPFSDIDLFSVELSTSVNTLDLRDEKAVEMISEKFDLVFSIHCKQLFPTPLVNKVKCINIHPGYNPYNRGWYPQVFSILNEEVIGATIHEIDEEIDNGAIIARELIEKSNIDTSGTLYDKILNKELEMFDTHILSILHNSYKVQSPEKKGRLYLKNDFKELCCLDLNQQGTMGDFIKTLRALTHKDFKNAYYIDSKTGEKIYISINICK